jgi:hypothetical protein
MQEHTPCARVEASESVVLGWLSSKPSRTSEEQELIVTMQNTWEKARELGCNEGTARRERATC